MLQRSTENPFDFMPGVCAYMQMCAFQNKLESTEYTTDRLLLSCRNNSRMSSENSSIVHDKSCEFLCKCDFVFCGQRGIYV